MTTSKPSSLQHIIRIRQQDTFVGREKESSYFEENIRLPVDNKERQFLFNVFGQGGIGKTWLLHRYQQLAEDRGYVTALANEAQTDILTVMMSLSEQLGQQGHKLSNFDNRYRVYRQKRQELEADPQAPQGTMAFLGHTLAKVGTTLARHTHVGEIVFSFVDDEALHAQVSEWGNYIAKKLTNKDEIRLMLEPVQTLTPLFLDDLRNVAKKRSIGLFFDTYEHTGAYLDDWLRSLLQGRYGALPPNIALAIAGRRQLNWQQWELFDGLLVRLELEPFTDTEAREFLLRKAITDPQVIDLILRISGLLPLLVATLAVKYSSHLDRTLTPSSTAVDCFLKWVEDSKHRIFVLDAAIPRRLNQDILAILLDKNDVAPYFEWLKQLPFVEEISTGWFYHDIVRSQMLHYKHRESPQKWADLHSLLMTFYEELCSNLKLRPEKEYHDTAWQEYKLEILYHRLCLDPNKYLPFALNGYLAALDVERSFAQHWASTVRQAGEDSGVTEIEHWGKQLNTRDNESIVATFTSLLENQDIERQWHSTALRWRGVIYKGMGLQKQALDDFSRSIELRPDYTPAIGEKALLYAEIEQYDEALIEISNAIQLDSSGHWLAHRGDIYRQIENNELALADFDKSIDLGYENHWAYGQRAIVLRNLNRYDEAIDSFMDAERLESDCSFCIAERGETFRLMEKYTEALSDFDRAIFLNNEDVWAISHRGVVHATLRDYDLALEDFNRTIALSPSHWTYEQKGVVLRTIGRYRDAINALTQAEELEPNCSACLTERGQAYCLIQDYGKALDDFNKAVEIDEYFHWAYEQKGLVLRRLKRYEDAIHALTQAERTDPDCSVCIAERGQTYFLMQNYDRALEDLNKAIRMDDTYHWAYERKGAALLSLKRYQEAVASLSKAHELNSECVDCLIARFQAYANMNDINHAFADLRNIFELLFRRVRSIMSRRKVGQQQSYDR